MIIRKNVKIPKSPASTNIKAPKSSVIKKEDFANSGNSSSKQKTEPKQEQEKSEAPKKQENLDDFEKIDISLIEFKERVERRRGDRRRGYRRIDERSLVSRAQQEAHSIKELAAREGYQNGFKKSQEELDELKATLREFLNLKDEVYEKLYPHILEVALAATEKIIKKEVELSPDILKNVIIAAMDELNSDVQKVEIKVNSADIEFARASLPEMFDTKLQEIKINVNSDDSVQQGSCIIIANNGVIDANFTTQLAVLQNAFGIYKGGV